MVTPLKLIPEDLHAVEGAFQAGSHVNLSSLVLLAHCPTYGPLPHGCYDAVVRALEPIGQAMIKGVDSKEIMRLFGEQFGLTGNPGQNDYQMFRAHISNMRRVGAVAYYRLSQKLSIRQAADKASFEHPELGGSDVVRRAWETHVKGRPDWTGKNWSSNPSVLYVAERFAKHLP